MAVAREWLRASLLIALGILVVLVIGGLIMLAGIAFGANHLLAAFIGTSCAFWILVRYGRQIDQQ